MLTNADPIVGEDRAEFVQVARLHCVFPIQLELLDRIRHTRSFSHGASRRSLSLGQSQADAGENQQNCSDKLLHCFSLLLRELRSSCGGTQICAGVYTRGMV